MSLRLSLEAALPPPPTLSRFVGAAVTKTLRDGLPSLQGDSTALGLQEPAMRGAMALPLGPLGHTPSRMQGSGSERPHAPSRTEREEPRFQYHGRSSPSWLFFEVVELLKIFLRPIQDRDTKLGGHWFYSVLFSASGPSAVSVPSPQTKGLENPVFPEAERFIGTRDFCPKFLQHIRHVHTFLKITEVRERYEQVVPT